MFDVDRHVEALPAVRGDGVGERAEQRRDQCLDLRSFVAWAEPDPGLEAWGRHMRREHVDAEVHPDLIGQRLQGLHDAGLRLEARR